VYLPEFELTRPRSLDEAISHLAELDGDASVYMGGTELLLLMKLGLSSPERLVDCKQLDELRGLELRDETIRIGAGSTHAELERSDLLREVLPEFVAMERRIANIRIRTAGTLGGNLCFADPNSDPMTLLMALGATLEAAGPQGRREIRVEDFAAGPYESALESDEILLSITIPVPSAAAGVAYERVVLRERPVASVAVVVEPGQPIRVAVGGAGQVARREPELEALLSRDGEAATSECADVLKQSLSPADDLDGSAEYKRHLAGVLLAKAVRRALN
jgi:carbon-monoxide dehydrogenase medium subunit